MFGFIVCCGYPVIVEPKGEFNIRKACDDIPMKVNCVEFDMGNGVEQGNSPLRCSGFALWHIPRVEQLRCVRSRRPQRRLFPPQGHWRTSFARRAPFSRAGLGKLGFPASIRTGQDCKSAARKRIRQGTGQSVLTASKTASACPGTFTLRQISRTTPSPSIRNVERSIPM